MATVITAGNATNGLSFTADNTGSFDFKTGTGAGTTAISISSSQIATFTAAPIGAGMLTSGTAVTSTSGASIEFTGIPSWVKRITVMLYDVSTSGSSPPQIQIGSTTFTTTGYTSTGQNGITVQSSTTGFITTGSWSAASIKSGTIVLTNITGNAWVASGVSLDIPGANSSYCSGRVTIGGTLDRVRLTTTGADTFDLGSVNILYE